MAFFGKIALSKFSGFKMSFLKFLTRQLLEKNRQKFRQKLTEITIADIATHSLKISNNFSCKLLRGREHNTLTLSTDPVAEKKAKLQQTVLGNTIDR